MYKVTIHFKTGTKQTVKAPYAEIIRDAQGVGVKLGQFDNQAHFFDRKDVLAVFLEDIKEKREYTE